MYVAMHVPYMVQIFDGESVDSFDKILAIYPIKFSQWLFACKVALIGTIRQNFTCQIFSDPQFVKFLRHQNFVPYCILYNNKGYYKYIFKI